ncbi:unnamed protein product [Rotaria sp. Silwood2]|nr:unnamed protein product [Rotaria sp. Silwood2]
MYSGRYRHTASILTNGKLLVTGGLLSDYFYFYGAILYDPSVGNWTMINGMHYARERHTASVLTNGNVLVTGGYNGSTPLDSVELYDPLTGTWRTTGSMNCARFSHTASVLTNGQVLNYWWI